MKTYCINCINFRAGNISMTTPGGGYGPQDVCIAKGAPINDFVNGIANPSLINTVGECNFYAEKQIIDAVIEDKVE